MCSPVEIADSRGSATFLQVQHEVQVEEIFSKMPDGRVTVGLMSKVASGSRVSSLLQIRSLPVLISERSSYKAYLAVDLDNTCAWRT